MVGTNNTNAISKYRFSSLFQNWCCLSLNCNSCCLPAVLLPFSHYLGYLGPLAILRMIPPPGVRIWCQQREWRSTENQKDVVCTIFNLFWPGKVSFCPNHIPLTFWWSLFSLLSLYLPVFVSILSLSFFFCCYHIFTFLSRSFCS